jgi:magnesium-transporting ATPase (P-type)
MATGDHPKTATAIAKAVSIITDVEGDLTMAASDFDQMTEEEVLMHWRICPRSLHDAVPPQK